jgi:hypothetical protein
MPCPRREDIRDIDPAGRSPTEGVEQHVDVKHGCHGSLWRANGGRTCGRVSDENGSNDVEEQSHAQSGNSQRDFATEFINTPPDEDGGRDKLEDTVDTGCEEGDGGACKSDSLEDLRGIVSEDGSSDPTKN